MLYYESKLSIDIYNCMDDNYEMFFDTLDNVNHKYELYQKMVKIMQEKGYALALATSTRSVVNHQHDQIHKYNSSTLLGIADKVWFFISLPKTIIWKMQKHTTIRTMS